jgi:hypothetical protein
MPQLIDAWLSMIVRGHSAFAAMLSARCSAAIPIASRAIPIFVIM